MRTSIILKVMVTPQERARLVEFFGEEGAEVIMSHIDELEETFGSASIIIRRVMNEGSRNE
jgi:hypothetical protein